MRNAWIENTELEKLRHQNTMMKSLMQHMFKDICKLTEENMRLKAEQVDGEAEVVQINELLDYIAQSEQ